MNNIWVDETNRITKEHVEAIGNFLSTYYTDLKYIYNFQQFKHDTISVEEFLQKDTGSFYSFLIEFRIIRNITQGSAKELLNETNSWVNGNHADDVDGFAKKLSRTHFTSGRTLTSLASKVLFLNNPWDIIPIDARARKALSVRKPINSKEISRIHRTYVFTRGQRVSKRT